jgi:hypothetical protein
MAVARATRLTVEILVFMSLSPKGGLIPTEGLDNAFYRSLPESMLGLLR